MLTLNHYLVRLMVWEASIEPRIVCVKEYLLPKCRHQLRCVRSDKLVADGCRDLPYSNMAKGHILLGNRQ